MDKRNDPILNRTDLIIMGSLALAAIILRVIPGLRIIDDAYITYRYAANVAGGVGFVYNPGEYVLGTTTPLYTLLLAILSLPFKPEAIPQISVIVNTLSDGIGVGLLYLIGKTLMKNELPGLLLGLLWAAAPKSVTFAIGGMETSFYIMLMLGAFAAWLLDRTSLSAALTGLATLTRPDALIWAGPLGLAMIVQHWIAHKDQPILKRLPWREGLIYVAVLLPWIVYGTITFGSPMTHSVSAKLVAYYVKPTEALVVLIQHYSTPFFEFDTFGSTGAMVGAIAYTLLAVLGALFLYHADWRSLPLTIFPWIYFLVFAIANPLIFRWYVSPPTPLHFLCIVGGLWGLIERLIKAKWKQWALVPFGLLWVFTSLNAWDIHPDHGPDRPAPNMAWYKLELLYEEAARSIAPEVTDETVVAAGDIGAVGWYSGARILDTLGLISPESTAYYPIPDEMLGSTVYAIAPDLIIDIQPDYIIILETYGRNGLFVDDRFWALYEVREILDTDIYGSEGMYILEKIAD